MSTITSETTYEPLNPRNTDKIQCDFTHFRAEIDQDEDKLPRGVSYIPFADYPVAVQNNPKYLHSRENIYNGYLTICWNNKYPFDIAYYAMNYFERYLSVKVVDEKKYLMCASICLKLAISMFKIDQIIPMSMIKQQYQEVDEDPVKLEVDILNTLSWRLTPVTPYQAVYKLLQLTNQQDEYSKIVPYLNLFLCNINSVQYTVTYIAIVLLCFYFRYHKNMVPYLLVYFSREIQEFDKLHMLHILNPKLQDYSQLYYETFIDPPIDDPVQYKSILNQNA